MTHDARLPTLEQIMNGSPYDLVDTPFATEPMEAWRAQSMALGVGGALASLHKLYQLVRNDAADAATRADEAQAREALVIHLCDQVAAMRERINRLADALEARQRADAEAAERQHKLDEEPIELPPDLDRPQDLPPAPIGDTTPSPSGDLHEVAATEEPPSADKVGDLPKELAEPPPPVPEPKGSVYPQPTAISLNKE